MVQAIGLVHVRDQQVRTAVIVIITPGDTLAAAVVANAGRVGDVGERAIAVIAVELSAVARVGFFGLEFASDIKVDMPVAVEVGPGSGLGGDRIAQASDDRHIGEPAMSVVAQQRGPSGALPTAAQEQDVEVTVVVVVGVVTIQGPDLRIEAGAGGTVVEGAVAAVDEQGDSPASDQRSSKRRRVAHRR